MAAFQAPAAPSGIRALSSVLTHVTVVLAVLLSMKQMFRPAPWLLPPKGTRILLAVALPMLALVSGFWSVAPDATIADSARFLMYTLVGFGMAWSVRPPDIAPLVAHSVFVLAILSAVALIVFPSLSIDIADTRSFAINGSFSTKNVLGRMFALGIVATVIAVAMRTLRRGVAIAYFVTFASLVIASGSQTAIVASLATLALTALAAALRRSVILTVFVFPLALLGAIYVAQFVPALTGSFLTATGRDLSLTGRTDIWAAVLPYIEAKTTLGYGWAGFWPQEGYGAMISATVGFITVHSHNGVLDTMLGLGAVGVAILVTVLLLVLTDGLHRDRSIWPVAFATFVIISDLTESTSTNGIFWPLLVATLLAGGRSLLAPNDEKAHARAG